MTAHIEIYVDFSEIKLDSGTYMTELTWLEDDGYDLIPHHYFISYPGAKEVESLLTTAIGGKPLIRYHMATTLRAFLMDIHGGAVVSLVSEEKIKQFKNYIEEANLDCTLLYRVFDDGLIKDDIYAARAEAAKRFGNAI